MICFARQQLGRVLPCLEVKVNALQVCWQAVLLLQSYSGVYQALHSARRSCCACGLVQGFVPPVTSNSAWCWV